MSHFLPQTWKVLAMQIYSEPKVALRGKCAVPYRSKWGTREPLSFLLSGMKTRFWKLLCPQEAEDIDERQPVTLKVPEVRMRQMERDCMAPMTRDSMDGQSQHCGPSICISYLSLYLWWQAQWPINVHFVIYYSQEHGAVKSFQRNWVLFTPFPLILHGTPKHH